MSKNRVKGKIDISGFGAVVKELARMSGKDFAEVLEAEVGAVLKGAISRTKIAKPEKIVGRNMPLGKSRQGEAGAKLIRKGDDGKVYHVGEPVVAFRNPDTAQLNKNMGKEGTAKGKWPTRGGTYYANPYSKIYKSKRGFANKGQKWVNNKKDGKNFQALLQEYERRTDSKLKYRGLGASQFYFMAEQLGIQMTGRIKQKKIVSSKVLGAKIKPFLQTKKFQRPKFMYSIRAGSAGLRQSRHSNAQRVLMLSTKARINFFKKAVKNEWTKDLKKYMPKNYPLLFK